MRFTVCLCTRFLSRVGLCAVAQYVVSEAKAKVNGRGPFTHPTPPKPLNQFWCNIKYITTSPQVVDVQNLVRIDSAVTDLRMREKTRFVWIFLLTYLSIYLSISLSVSSSGLQVTVFGRLVYCWLILSLYAGCDERISRSSVSIWLI